MIYGAAIVLAMGATASGGASAGGIIGYQNGASQYCTLNGAAWGSCSTAQPSVLAFTGNNFAYMASEQPGQHGAVWAADNNAGIWYGTGGPAGSNSLYLSAAGTMIQGPGITLNSASGVNMSSTQMHNLAAGSAAGDAVNMSQLNTTNTNVTAAQTTANTANATANMGWNLSADAGATSQNIAPGGTANFAAGTNATVTRSGNTITMGVVNNPTFSGMVTANGGLIVGAGKTVSMGGNTVTNVANGVNNNDAVSVAQLAPIVTALGNGAAINGTTGVVTGPSYALTNANSIGGTSGAATDVGTAFGKVDTALGTLGTSVTAAQTTANAANTTANKGWNLSTDAGVTSQNIAPGGTANFAAGTNATVTRSGNTVTVGVVNNPTFSGTLTANGGLTVGAGQTVDMGGNKVTNVASGALSAASTDAVNGSQLYATNQQVAQNTTDIAGNTTAIAGNTTSISNITNQINNGTVGLVQQAAAGADLTVGKSTDGAAVDFADKNGNTRTLKNVTAGVSATDAVNMSQLNATNANVAGNTTAITNLGTRVTTNEGSISTINTTIAGMNGQLADAVKYDSAAHDTVTLGNAGTPVQVTNVKNGALSAASSDAVNGSQLYATNQQVAQNTSDIAGNTTAIASNTTSISNITNQINNGTVSLVQQAAAGADLTVGNATDGAAVDFADKNVNTRTLKNVTAGVAATDAVNMSQLNATNANVAGNTTAITNLGTRVTTNEGSISTINTTIAGMNGQLADAVKYDSAAHDTVTLGNAGTPVQVTNVKNGALSAASSDAVNGSQLYATNQQVAQNTTNIAGNTSSINNLQNTVNNISGGTVGLVQQVAAGADLTVGKATDGVAVDFADKNGNTRTLKNVTAGVADTDAVNMSQLNTTNANVTRVEGKADQQGSTTAAALGGGASYNSTTGAIVAPSYTLHNADGTTATANDVGTALTNVDGRVVQNTTDIAGNTTSINSLQNTVNNISGGTVGLVQQAAAGADLTVGKDTDGAAVNFADKNGNTRTLKDVTAGVAATDAVNMSQLNATNANVAGNTTAITNLGTRVTTNEGSISTINTTIAGMNGQLADAVKYDSAAHDTVTLGNAGTPVQVTNVKNGALSAASTDAVNGSQLYATNQQVAQNTSDIAGNTTAIAGNTTSINNITNQINSGTVGLVQQAAAGADLTVGKDTDGTAVNFADKNGNTRTLKNVTAGVADTDAVNMSQLNTTNANVTRVEGKADQQGSTTAAALGGGASYNSTTGAISTPSYTLHNADGTTAKANDVGTAVTNIDGRVTQNTTDIAGNTTAINTINTQINSGTIGLVQQASAGANLTVGKSTDGAAVDFQGTAGARKLLNVADGTVAAGSKDAVNGGQLAGVSQSVADAIGGGSTVNSDGSISAPSYVVHNADGSTSTVNNVGNAITNLDGRVTQNTTDISTINTTINGMNGQLADAVKYDSAAHDKVTLGNAGTPVQVTNVAAGNVSATSTDAVNGSQLNATNQAVTNLDGRVTNVENTVNTMAGAVSNVTNITSGQAGMFQVSKDSNSTQPVASGSKSTAGGNAAVASGNNSTALGNAAVASADNSVAVGANSVADRSNSVSMGSADHERQVTNVAAGTANTDAVNVGQLKAAGVMNADGSTNTAVTYDTNADGSTSVTLNGGGNAAVIHNVAPGTSATDAASVGQVQQVADWSKSYTDQQVRNVGRQANGGVASAMAMSSIPQAMVNGGHSIGAGVGNFGGQSSVAVGMSAMSATGKFAVKLNLSATTGGQAGVGVGASYNW